MHLVLEGMLAHSCAGTAVGCVGTAVGRHGAVVWLAVSAVGRSANASLECGCYALSPLCASARVVHRQQLQHAVTYDVGGRVGMPTSRTYGSRTLEY